MTEGRRARRPSLRAVGAASLLVFAVVLALLVAQMRLGRDPVLGARRAAAVAPATRQVLVRRVIVRRIVVDEIHDADVGGATVSARAVVVAPSGPVAAAPAPAPAPTPAPAPAPAPLVTKSS
jgi:hypothetical protein